jgi:WD40 repeat protein
MGVLRPEPDVTVELDADVLALAHSPVGDELALGCRGDILLADPVSLQVRRRWTADPRRVRQLVYHCDGTRLASAGFDGMVCWWDTETGASVAELAGHEGRVWAVDVVPGGATLVSSGGDHSVRLWRQDTAPLVLRGHGAPVRSVAFSLDGALVASGAEDREIRIWDAGTGHGLGVLTGHSGKVRCLSWYPDGTLLSGSSDGTLRWWDVRAGRQLHLVQAHGTGRTGKIRALTRSSDHRLVLTGSEDGTARLWTGDGKRLLAELCAAGTGDTAGTEAAAVTAVSISRTGTRAVTASSDGVVRGWPLDTGVGTGGPHPV